MIEIKDKIEKAFDNVSPDKLIKGWNQKGEKLILSIWAVIPIAFVLWAVFSPGHFVWIIPCCFVWVAIGAPSLYFFFNAKIKRSIEDIGIRSTPGLFSFWANSEYREYKLKEFHLKLCGDNLLTNSEYDIELTEQYLRFCDEEAKDSFKNVKFIFGGVLLAFCIPVWNQYLTWLFKGTSNDQLGLTVLISVAIVLLIFSTLIIASLLHTAYSDHYNKESTKFKNIAKHLKKLNLNLKLKYKK